MRISCPRCHTLYDLPPGAVGPEGRSVRCARCGTSWRASAEPEPAMAEAESLGGFDPADEPLVDGDVLPSGAEFYAPQEPGPEQPPPEKTYTPHPPPGFSSHAAQRRPAKRKPAKAPGVRRAGGLIAVAAAVAALGALVVCRTPIVAAVPDLAGLYAAVGMPVNLRGLAIEDIRATRELENGSPMLIVEGNIVNVAGAEVTVPAIRLAIRADGRQEIYAWSVEPATAALGPGASAPFRSVLPNPPPDARDVYARFDDRRTASVEAR